MSPLFGFIAIAVAPFGLNVRPTSASTLSVRASSEASSVKRMSDPGCMSLNCSSDTGSPRASFTMRCSPSVPPSLSFNCCSIPRSPLLSIPTVPITCDARAPSGYRRRESSMTPILSILSR